MSKVSAIVLAAGKGSRMKSEVPKQFIEVNGKPLITYALEAYQMSAVDEIILVTGEDDISLCKKIVSDHQITKCTSVAAGGNERAWSVLNGIKAASGDYVLIHDGARPLVSQRLIADTISAVQQFPAVVPVIPVKDTIRQIMDDGTLSEAFDRSKLVGMQTPQAFRRADILKAYDILLQENTDFSKITDDVMIMEQGLGVYAHPVTGEETNKKMTTPEDLEWLNEKLA